MVGEVYEDLPRETASNRKLHGKDFDFAKSLRTDG